MLRALAECPPQICQPISWIERLQSNVCVGLSVLMNVLLCRAVGYIGFDVFKLSGGQLTAALLGTTVSITAGLYVYYVYIVTATSSSTTSISTSATGATDNNRNKND